MSASTRAPSGAAVMRPSVTDALARAFFEEWAETGLGALSLERVAKRAGVGKAALYRRWSSKQDMAIDLIKSVGLNLTPIPDSGSLLEDLRLILLSLRRTLRHPLIRRILPDLHAEMARTSALSAEIRDTLQYERRERGKVIVDRAIARGELPACADRDLANDALASILYARPRRPFYRSDGRTDVTGGKILRDRRSGHSSGTPARHQPPRWPSRKPTAPIFSENKTEAMEYA